MKQEKTLFAVTVILLALMIAATVICAVKYMHEEPLWNRDPAPIVTDAPEEGQNSPWREMVTANLPPGRYSGTIILHNGGDSDAAD